MNPALLLKIAPSLPVLRRVISQLGAEDIATLLATAVGVEDAREIAEVIVANRSAPTDELIAAVLNADVTKRLVLAKQAALANEERTLFARCPRCNLAFETELP